jgi:phosphonatase-like hydrolase
MTARATRGILENIDLMVCDMAGTTVEEGGLVYKILQRSMNEFGLNVDDDAMHPWHGAKKEAVIEHFARQSGVVADHELEDKITRIANLFTSAIDEAYFDEAATISHIDASLFSYFSQLKAAGIKIGLDTGYPANIQEGLVKRLGFDKVVDGWISSYDVAEGRPYPYMIHNLMERLRVENVKRVCKVGDSVRDIEEGRNAGCGLVVGVLSGADSAEDLMAAGADVVADCVTSLPVPRRPQREQKMRLPDLS